MQNKAVVNTTNLGHKPVMSKLKSEICSHTYGLVLYIIPNIIKWIAGLFIRRSRKE